MSDQTITRPEKKIEDLTPKQIASICDHTFLKLPETFLAVTKQGKSAVKEREKAFNQFFEKTLQSPLKPFAICVRHDDCHRAKQLLEQHGEKDLTLAAAVGFPSGSWATPLVKATEARLALEEGAQELDTTLPYEQLINGDIHHVQTDLQAVTTAAHQYGAIVKLILETSELTDEQIKEACKIATECGVDFVKTSTGYGAKGATPEALRIMKEHFKGGIKISGGVSPDNVRELLMAASRAPEGLIDLNPRMIRIGESSLLQAFEAL